MGFVGKAGCWTFLTTSPGTVFLPRGIITIVPIVRGCVEEYVRMSELARKIFAGTTS